MKVPSLEHRIWLAGQVETFHANLRADPDGGAARYLTDRGITTRTIDRFKLGYTGDHEQKKLAHRLVIPYLSPAGPWHLKYRCITDHDCKSQGHGKYIYDDTGAEQHLYNASTLLTADRVVVVEGELDAISVEQAGANAVAFPGADTWKKNRWWRWCFDSVTEVVVVADGDDPAKNQKDPTKGVGEEAARMVADSLRTSLPDVDVRVVVMPLGHDSNSYLAEHGQVEYLDQIGWL
jgi:DNA primase